MNPAVIETVKGPVAVDTLGIILPHEHLFTDLRGPLAPGYGHAAPEDVARVMEPHLAAAYAAGVTALIECSTVGVGRSIAVLRHLAELTPMHIVAPTGIYREAMTPPPLRDLTAEELASLWMRELSEGIEGTEVRAGFIKLSVSDNGPSHLEVRNLRAAARAGRLTGAAVASHTPNGSLALAQMQILEAAGLDLERFIWVHAQLESAPSFHRKAARRGAYVEFDGVGAPWHSQSAMLNCVLALIDAGYAEKILLSHDAGWYDPSRPGGQPDGSGIRGYTALVDEFLPALRARGATDDLIRLMTVSNPARAFALPERRSNGGDGA